MAVTKKQLFDGACFHLGEDVVEVDAAANVAPVAAKLRTALPIAAPLILALHPWNFARANKQLTIDGDADPGPWDYAFTKPSMERLNWISTTGRQEDRITSGWDDIGGVIVSNYGTLWCDYVRSDMATDEHWGRWPYPPAAALSSAIADLVSKPVTQSRATQADLSQRTMKLASDAMTWDSMQSPSLPRRKGRWNTSRRGFASIRDERA